MKLTLTQKGILLVAIPLLFQFLFVGVLALMLIQVEKESARIFRSEKIGNCSNKLIKDVFEISAISHSDLIELISTNGYKEKITTIRGDLNDLLQAADNDAKQQSIVKKSVQAGEQAFMLIEQLRSAFISGDTLSAIDQLKQLRGELRSCMQAMISQNLLSMAKDEKDKAEEAHRKQLAFRQQIKLVLVIGLILNTAITISIAFVIFKKIVSRIAILVDNNYRLASRLPLNSLIGGEDEIGNLDSTFHEMAASLAVAKQKEKSMIEHSMDAICSMDASGKITAANPACGQIWGYPQEVLMGNNLRSIILDEDIYSFDKSLSLAVSGKAETNFELRIKQKDGNIVDLLWSVHWVDLEQSFFCVGHDISERKEIERLKQQFMAMVSHDLRTPLATIVNYLEMLADGLFGDLSSKGTQLLQIAEKNSSRMLALINDLLDLEKAEFEGLKIECTTTLLTELIDQSIQSVSNLATKKEVQIIFNPVDLSVHVDNKRVLQVLVNLLSNAIKFSPKNGEITIRTEESAGTAIVFISDQGRGVPYHMQEKIFEQFQQVEIADAVDKGGSGLGLAICKTIIELHGGSIKVQNNPDKGSTFSFSVPLAASPAMQPA